MLIILNGSETIHKRFFAREIRAAMNTFSVDGYDVKFSNFEITVRNSENVIVYQSPNAEFPAGINTLLVNEIDGSSNEVGKATFNKILELNTRILNTGVRDNHFSNVFADPLYDLGLVPTSKAISGTTDTGYIRPHTYEDVLNNYNTREIDNFVITGIFSVGFIDKIKEDLGSDKVVVVNIIRNPSTCYVLNEKDSSYYTVTNPTFSPNMDYSKLIQSLITTAILKNKSDVINLKFEDIVKTGKFQINGVEINSPNSHVYFNDYITKWERDVAIPISIVTPEMLNSFNTEFSNYYLSLTKEEQITFSIFDQEKLNNFNEVYNSSITAEQINSIVELCAGSSSVKWQDAIILFNAIYQTNATIEQFAVFFPMNMFDILGYTPLSYEEIISNS
jgi:hypothetical protein